MGHSAAGLPFAVPAPVPALDGATLVHTDEGSAALFRWIEGALAGLPAVPTRVPPYTDVRPAPPLPRQLIHADYARPNILMADDRVCGVLDFEFLTYDLRLCDYAVGLNQQALILRDECDVWPLVAAFSRGYAGRVSLTPAKITELPRTVMLTLVGSLLHCSRRALLGLADAEAVLRQGQYLISVDDWFRQHGPALVERTLRWHS